MLFQKTICCSTAPLLMLILTGCVPSEHVEKRPVPMENCEAEAFNSLLWKRARVLDATILPKGTRIIYPDQVVTADYRVDRLNIKVGKLDRIEQVFCG